MSISQVAISDLGRIVTGKTPSTKNPAFFDGEYQFVTPSDMDWKTYYCWSTERTVTDDAKKSHLNQFIPAEAVMVTCIGNTIGKCGISVGECLTNQQINTIIPAEGNNPRFVYYLLIHNTGLIRGVGLGGGAATPILNKTSFSRVKLRVPPKRSWDGIASVLSAYDDLIENNRRRIQLLEQAVQLLYREWFVHLRFPGHEHVTIIDGVPEGWDKGTIVDLGQIITGKTPSTKTPENFGGNIPFVKTPDMHRSRIIVETEECLSERGVATQPKKTIPIGTILVACIGAKLGVVSITSCLCQTNQQINAVVPRKDYMAHYSLFVLIDIKPRLEAMGGGATMPNVNKTKFASIPILIPPLILLQEFEEFAKALFRQILLLHRQNSCLVNARDLLLPRLMNGEVTP